MDVIFAENQPFFTQSYLLGETLIEDKGYPDLLLLDLPTKTPDIAQSKTETSSKFQNSAENISTCIPAHIIENLGATSSPNSIDSGLIAVTPFQVYSRRRPSVPEPVQVQQTEPQTGTESSLSDSSSLVDDLDQPIAIRKGIRRCTQYPMSHFVTFCPLEICLQNIEPS